MDCDGDSMKKRKCIMIVVCAVVVIMGLIVLIQKPNKDQWELSFGQNDIEYVLVQGVSESTARQTKKIDEKEEITEIWEFLESLEVCKEKNISQTAGDVGYLINVYLKGKSNCEITLFRTSTRENVVYYLVVYESESKMMISTKDFGEIIFE